MIQPLVLIPLLLSADAKRDDATVRTLTFSLVRITSGRLELSWVVEKPVCEIGGETYEVPEVANGKIVETAHSRICAGLSTVYKTEKRSCPRVDRGTEGLQPRSD